MPDFQASPSVFMKLYIQLCAFVNMLIIKLKIPAKLIKSPQKKRNEVNKIGDAAAEDPTICIKVRIMKATNLPAKDGSGEKGTCDAYVKVKMAGKQFQTQPVPMTLNPDYNNEYKFESRKDATGNITFELWDSDTDADDFIGKFSVPVAKIIKDQKIEKAFELYDSSGMMPIKNERTRKATKLRVMLSWDSDSGSADSEWLNGILRKGYRCFAKDVDTLVRAKLMAAFSGLKLPVLTLNLESFSIGEEAPYFNELRLLPTRSNKDLQLRAHLRWVSSGDFGIKVRAQTKFGLSVSVSVNNLEIDFPVWIQAHLQDDLEKPCTKFQMAATAEPKIRFSLALGAFSTSSFPGIEEGIDFAIRKALKSVLVLPKKITQILVPDKPLVYTQLEKDAVARLSIKILEAEEVEKKQQMDKLNPYVIVTATGGTHGDSKRLTKAVDATPKNACEWNEYQDFLITNEEQETVTFQLMDQGKMSDDPCGKFVLNVSELRQAADSGAGWREDWFPLTDCKTGRIKLAIEYARFVPDDGPTEIDRAMKKAAGPVVTKTHDYGQLVVQVTKGSGMPKTMFGKPNPYVKIKYTSYAGLSNARTREINDDCNPEWDEYFTFRERVELDLEKQEDRDISIVVNDSSESRMSNPVLGTATLKLKQVLAKPGEFTLEVKDASGKQIGDKCTVVVQANFEKVASDPIAAVGSDWLNGILRKCWIVLTDKIEEKVKATVDVTLQKLLKPEPDPETGETPPVPAALTIYQDLTLETFELGQEPPFFNELSILNTRSVQDIQLNAALRWVTSGNLNIKVRARGKTGVPDAIADISRLELFMPLWIQARLAGGGTGLGADVLEIAATNEPIVKVGIKVGAAGLPLNVSPGFVNWAVVKGLGGLWAGLNGLLLLPNRMEICLAKDTKTGKALAANQVGAGKRRDWPRDLRTHNGLIGCLCDVGVPPEKNDGKKVAAEINPACPVCPGEYTCVVGEDGKPIYNCIADFKAARFRLDKREANAVGRLTVKLIEADDLHDPDAFGTVDAFVEAQILGTGQKKTSSTVNNDTAPVWSEVMDFLICDEQNEVVKFEVYDKDLFKNDFLGEVEVPIKDLVTKTGWNDAWMPLQKNSGGGELHLALRYAKLAPNDGPPPPSTFVDDVDDDDDVTTRDLEEEEESPYKGKLMVTVSKAENLIKLDTAWTPEGGLDPYVILDFGKQEKKTKTKSGLNPIFNQTFGFDCKDGGSTLVIALKDEEKLQKDRVIGFRSIKLEDLMDRPNRKWVDSFRLVDPATKQECRNAAGDISLLYLTVQYVEAGEPLPTEPRNMTGGDGDVVSRDLDAAPAPPTTASLFVRVVQANDLQKMDWTGSSDPYVSVTMSGEGKEKTRVMDKCLDPVWNEDFLYQVDPDSTKILQLVIKDDDQGRVNEYMGQVEVPLQEIKAAKTMSKKVFPILDKKSNQVKGKSGKLATLTLDLEWK